MSTTNGTTNDEQNLNAMPTTEEGLFEAISAAMAKGDDDELSRLMAGEEPKVAADAPDLNVEVTTEDTPKVSAEVEAPVTDTNPPAANVEQTPDALKLIEHLKAELNNVKANVGRVSDAQSQIAKLQKVVDEQAAKIASMQSTPSKLEQRIAALKEIDPEMAETLLALKEELVPPSDPAAEAANIPDNSEAVSELERVRRVHPDIDYVLVGGAARAEWESWKSSLTVEQRAYAESPHAEELIIAFGAFKSAQAAKRAASTEVNAATNAPLPDAGAAALVEERRRKLAASATTKNTPLKTTGTDVIVDPDAMVAKLMKEIQQRDNLIR